jgi:membrane-associated phospholipid phosphatase
MEQINKLFIFSLLIFVLCLFIEILAKNPLQDSSTSYIRAIQKDWTESSKIFFMVISVGAESLVMGIGFIYYVVSGSQNSLMCIHLTFAVTWFGDFLKMVIAHPRPFWYSSDVKGFSCASDYGSPSGHATVVGSVIMFFFFLNFQKNRVLSTLVAAVALGILGFDRNYLGVHFYFQVVLGFALAFLASICCFLPQIRLWIRRTSENLRDLVAFHIVVIVLLLSGVLVYFIRDPELKEDWKSNFKSDCSGSLNSSKALFKSLSEGSCLVICASFSLGLYLKQLQPRRGIKTLLLSLLILLIGAGLEQVSELFIKRLSRPITFLLLCLVRYLTGLYITILIPFILSKISPHISNESLSEESTIPLIKI